jgi:hypothetical protein
MDGRQRHEHDANVTDIATMVGEEDKIIKQ